MDTERASVLPVGALMKPDFVAVEPWDTIGEAAEKMDELDVGSAIVVDGGHLVGILTSRDLMRAIAGRTHSSEARVREWMTAEPRVARLDTPAEEAALMMARPRMPPLSCRSGAVPLTDGENGASVRG